MQKDIAFKEKIAKIPQLDLKSFKDITKTLKDWDCKISVEVETLHLAPTGRKQQRDRRFYRKINEQDVTTTQLGSGRGEIPAGNSQFLYDFNTESILTVQNLQKSARKFDQKGPSFLGNRLKG